MERTVTVLTRQGCHLCDEAMPSVHRAARMVGFTVRSEDVDAVGLADRYGERVPVVLGPGGEELVWGRVRTGGLLVALMRLRWRM